jgi:hypothetical protein
VDTIKEFESRRGDFVPEICRQRALEFAPEHFRKRFREFVVSELRAGVGSRGAAREDEVERSGARLLALEGADVRGKLGQGVHQLTS